MNARTWIAAAAVTISISATAHAESSNEVRAVSFTENGGVTRVNVRGAETPTFTVYKLEKPTRVVIDMPHSRLADALRGHESASVLQPNTWAVSTIASQQLDDGAVRIIVSMARPGSYDVKTDGNELVVIVTPRDAARKVETANPAELEAAKRQAELANITAVQSKADADQARAEAERLRKAATDQAAKADAAQKAVTQASAADIAKAKAAAHTAQAEAAKAKMQAAKASTDADDARKAAALAQIEADKTKTAAEQARRDALAEAARAKNDAQLAKTDAAAAKIQAAEAGAALERAKADNKSAVASAKAEADAAKREASMAKVEAAAAKQEAASVKADAAKKLAAMEQKAATAQAAEDKAREAAAAAVKERMLAEAAMKRAQQARDNADAADRTKLVADAKAAEDRLAKARGATAEADMRRTTAEQAATNAKKDLADSKTALASVESQRAAAMQAAKEANARKGEAEASLAALNQKRQAAERAADLVATRTKAQAKAESEMAAAKSRKASEDEILAARREVAKLTEERKRAEADLADRRKAVAQQQSEAARLEAAATEARDAASREESRRTQLAQQRETEERELAKMKAAKVQAQVAATPATAPAPVAVAQVAKVSNVSFKGNDASGVVELAMAGDASVELGEITATHVELIVDGAQLAQKLERTLDVSKFGSPVKKISSYNDRHSPNRIRFVAELSAPAIPTVVRDNGIVRWRFASTVVAAAPAKKMKTTNIPPTVVGGFGAASTPVTQQSVSQLPGAGGRGRRIYHGATVEFDFKDAPIHDLLRIIADTGGVNIVVPDTIDAKVTVRLKRVPWDQALEVILASHGLWYRREGNLYRIAPRTELDKEDENEAARRAAAVQAEAPKPEVVTLNYASADDLKTKLEGMKSPKGSIEVDGRTNSLIINDIAYNRSSITNLARTLDTQTPQITIEARIVEAQSTFVRQFGIQWGGRALAGAGGGNATGLIFPSSIGLLGGNTDGSTPEAGISALPSDFAINLPAATGTGEGGAIGMSLGSVGGNFNINLRLSALEDTGTVRIVSAPKITVLNNKSATIKSGVSIPISVVSASGTQTQFVQADLKLEVTPYVSQGDCSIAMKLNVTKNEPDFVNTGARGDPTILRREATTEMLVADGETSVLGGIYTRNSGLSYKKVPFFADLPVIGWFFKSRRENDTRTEILVFITPKITNKANLRCTQ